VPRRIDPQDRLQEGWEPPPVPDLRPDSPSPSRQVALPVVSPPAPTLCELGPCANYHRMSLELDAAKPMDGSETPMRIQTIRTCYPTPGVEMPLDESPIFECSRWTPLTAIDREARRSLRNVVLRSPDGQRYEHELNEWRDAQEKLRADELQQPEMPLEDMTVYDELRHAMVDGDRVELRLKGDPRVLHTFPWPALDISERLIQDLYGGNATYQVRIVHPTEHGDAISMIKQIKVPPVTKTEEQA
jgi:hypothetical protein